MRIMSHTRIPHIYNWLIDPRDSGGIRVTNRNCYLLMHETEIIHDY
jgi:hypothetical protein